MTACTASKMEPFLDKQIHSRDLFQPIPGVKKRVRTIVTKGIAGVGKTYCVKQILLEWTEGTVNQHMDFMLLLSFRQLNSVKDERRSLFDLVSVFYPTLTTITAEILEERKVLLIFDGLDESRLPLDFQHNETVSDATQTSSVDVLLTNLIKGNLLPSALLWITSRPAAANRIPPEFVDLTTEARGFSDPHKELYFRNRFREDENLANRIISHVKKWRSLSVMCRIPVCCWVTAVVLRHILKEDERAQLPKTMAEMNKHFLLIQTKIQNHKKKYHERLKANQQELIETDGVIDL